MRPPPPNPDPPNARGEAGRGFFFEKPNPPPPRKPPATTEDAPASSPHGCRRKRAIITYARRPSKAYRSVSLTISRRVSARRGAGSSDIPELLAASRSTSAVTLLFSDQ